MDQTESAYQIISGDFEECSAFSNLGGYDLLPLAYLHQVPDQVPAVAAGAHAYGAGDPVYATTAH